MSTMTIKVSNPIKAANRNSVISLAALCRSCTELYSNGIGGTGSNGVYAVRDSAGSTYDVSVSLTKSYLNLIGLSSKFYLFTFHKVYRRIRHKTT